MDNNKKCNDMNGEKVIDLLWEVKEGIKHPNKAYKELCILFNVSESFGSEPLKANEKHISLTVKFPTKSIEIREISEGTESVKTMELDWG
jgi:hypothetical protein